ncbi:MAG TPA: hypothetical protein VMY77_08095 [Chitinophagaceae bacterium]|nr:hypothetical protein [Chitinophagaceae bacterium]
MKLFISFLIGILCYGSAISQHTPLNELVKIKLPGGSEKLSYKQLQSFLIDKKGFNQNRDWTPKGDVYKINSMILQLNGAGITRSEKLEDTKKGFDEMGFNSINYTSEIKSINNYKVLIMHLEGRDYASYSFFSVNNSNTKVLNGRLDYDKFDTATRDIAINTLSKLLKKMKFK